MQCHWYHSASYINVSVFTLQLKLFLLRRLWSRETGALFFLFTLQENLNFLESFPAPVCRVHQFVNLQLSVHITFLFDTHTQTGGSQIHACKLFPVHFQAHPFIFSRLFFAGIVAFSKMNFPLSYILNSNNSSKVWRTVWNWQMDRGTDFAPGGRCTTFFSTDETVGWIVMKWTDIHVWINPTVWGYPVNFPLLTTYESCNQTLRIAMKFAANMLPSGWSATIWETEIFSKLKAAFPIQSVWSLNLRSKLHSGEKLPL